MAPSSAAPADAAGSGPEGTTHDARRRTPRGLRLAVALGVTCVAVAIAVVIDRTWPWLPPELLLAAAVLVSALAGGLGAGALAVALAIPACAFILLPPLDATSLDPDAMPRLIVFAATSALIALLAGAYQRSLTSLRRSRDGLAARVEDDELREDRLHPLVHTIPALVWGASPEGLAEFFNGTWLSYTGFTAEQAKGIGWTDALHADDRPQVAETWRAIVASGEQGELEARLRRFDGTYRWFLFRAAPYRDGSGKIVRWFGTNTDIDDRRLAQAELQTLIESIPGMIAAASASGEQDYTNRRLLDFVDISAEDSKGAGWLATIHPDERDVIAAEWQRCIASGDPYDVLHRMRRHDGSYRWVHVRAEPHRAPDGSIVRWYAMLVDVHERRSAEEALGRSQAALAHVGRVTTMGELSASIAHEVNQPLAAIVNNAGACLALLPDAPDVAETREALRDIIADAERASAVVQRVRELSRNAPVDRTTIHVRDLVEDVLVLARYESAARGATIRYELDDDLPPASGDRVQLQQVLLNLVLNGIEAMADVEPARRILTICARADGADRAGVRLSVSDVGSGFAPGDSDRAFEAFYTTKAHGMGMGLAISRSIVESHGGRLWAEQSDGAGATLLLTLPAAADAAS